MNVKTMKLAAIAAYSAAALLLASCSSTPKTAGDDAVSVESFKMTATVAAVDPATRRVTLVEPNGAQVTYRATDEVVNFNQIHVGDRVAATVVKEVALSIRNNGAPPSADAGAAVSLARRGEKPGMMLAQTIEVTAVITATDSWNRTATLVFSDGSSRTMNVAPNVDMASIRAGDSVRLTITEALAIAVEKP